MAYTRHNYKTKKALMEDFLAGKRIEVYQPGPFPLSPGTVALEGPHYPEPHRWYASGEHVDGVLTGLKNPRGKMLRQPQPTEEAS